MKIRAKIIQKPAYEKQELLSETLLAIWEQEAQENCSPKCIVLATFLTNCK